MRTNFKQPFAITVSALILSFALFDYLPVQVESSGQKGSPGVAASRMNDKRAALRDSLRKAALKRLRASRWAQFGQSEAYELGATDMRARSTSDPRSTSDRALVNHKDRDGQTRVVVRDVGPELGASFSDAGFIFNREDPRQIILPTVQRIFRSLNGGRSWSPLDLLTPDGFTIGAFDVRQDPLNPNVLFAITGFGTYRSVDFGTTWTQLEEFPVPFLVDWAINEATSNVVLALTVPDFDFDNSALWRSDDGGATFEPQPDSGLPNAILDPDTGEIFTPFFERIVTTPGDPNIVYVVLALDETGYFPPSIYKSVDGGETFARLEAGPPQPHKVIPHPTQPNVLFVLVNDSPRIYRSVDGGASFEPVTSGLPSLIIFVSLDAHNPSHVYVAGRGVFRSTDGGNTFEPLGLTADQLGFWATMVSVDPSNPNIIYVNTNRGNFKSVNGGISFRSINKGWRGERVDHITFDNASNPSLYLAMAGGAGILKTRTRGNHYEEVPNTAGGHPPTLLVVAPTNPDMIMVGTGFGGLFRTTDGGRSWTLASIDTGLIGFEPGSSEIAIDPLDPNNVYFAAFTFPFERSGFFRSTNAGVSFQRTDILSGDMDVTNLAIDPIHPNVILTDSHFQTPLRSVDGGLSFSDGPIYWAGITDIAIDPKNSNNVYLVGTLQLMNQVFEYHSVVRSTDGGATYAAADAGLPQSSVLGMVIDPQNPARLYAWTKRGLFMTSDRATTWTLLEGVETIKAAQPVLHNTIAINPKKPNLLYLAGATVLEVEIHQSR